MIKYFKSGTLLLVLIATLILSSCIAPLDVAEPTNFLECEAAGYEIGEIYPRQCKTFDGEIFIEKIDVGGDVDEYGCLIAAGYTWNETEQACVREWLSTDAPDRYQLLSGERADEIAQEYVEELIEEQYPTSHSLKMVEGSPSPECTGCYFFKYQFMVDDMTVCGYEVRITIKAEDDMVVEANDLQYCRGELTGCSIKACPTLSEETCDILTDVSVCDNIDLDKGICKLNDDLTDIGEMGEKVYQPTAEIWCDGGN